MLGRRGSSGWVLFLSLFLPGIRVEGRAFGALARREGRGGSPSCSLLTLALSSLLKGQTFQGAIARPYRFSLRCVVSLRPCSVSSSGRIGQVVRRASGMEALGQLR